MRKNFSIFFLNFPILILFLSGCGQKLYHDTEFSMGTFVEVISSDPRAKNIVFEEFKRLESLFNLFDEHSELSRLNHAGFLVVSPELFDILKKSREFYNATQGAFDPTIAPLALVWKRAIKSQSLPSEEEIKNLAGLIGFDYVYGDEKTHEVRLMKSGAKLDLGAIAKGYAVDQALVKLKEAKVLSALVNAGGNSYGLGENNNKPWCVGIQDPRTSKHLIKKILLKDKGVATSGDYEQFFIFQNKRYSHIINPKTGYPAHSGIVSATVVASDATTADALATALVILGKDKAKEVLAHFKGVEATLIDQNGKVYDL